jgi:amidase
MNRRAFLSSTALAAVVKKDGRAREEHPFSLEELGVGELQEGMNNGRFTSERITELYLERIEQVDRRGPALRSIIELNPEALSTARNLDLERKAKGPRGPMHGIPVLLKDNIDTADKMQTTAGSLALADQPAKRDAFLVERLRTAGAVILGKTNLSEWANFRSTHSTSGWSGRGGQTLNPYSLDRNPCGSSSGSAVAVSANLVTVAVGTETDGSVVCPSSVCGIVGIKPTIGLISRAGIIPIAHSQDTAGAMGRSVRDAAILLSVMTGADPRDSATSGQKAQSDYTRFLDASGLRGMRIGVARQYFNISPAVNKVINDCITTIKGGGGEVVDPVEFPKFEAWRDSEIQVLLYEFKADLNAYLSERGAKVKSLADCIAFNRAHSHEEMPFFQQELMEQAQEKNSLADKDYKKALAKNHHLTRKTGIDALIRKYKLDGIVAPTAGPAWVTDWVNGDRVDSGCASPPAVAGYPHVTVPAGFVAGLPVGISFFGDAWSEPKLIKAAYAFEQLRKGRAKPRFLSRADFSS